MENNNIELNKIYNMDCLDGLRQIPDATIDLVVTDCPYHIIGGGDCKGNYTDKNGVTRRRGSGMHKERKTASKHVDLGGCLSDAANARSGAMFDFNDIKFSEWLPEVYRVLKDGTHCYIMINARNLCELQNEAEKVGFQFQQLLVWLKNNTTPNKYYLSRTEFILMLRKGAAKNINDCSMSNVLSVPNILRTKLHPTEKPTSLMRVLIEQSSKVGDVVLDPFMGSGSTAIAAKDCERSFIGFEIDPKYYNISQKRLNGHSTQTRLF